MTIVYCGETTCDDVVAISGSLGLKTICITHTLRDQGGNVMAVHDGQLHLRLPDEPWNPEAYETMQDYSNALKVKYPKANYVGQMYP